MVCGVRDTGVLKDFNDLAIISACQQGVVFRTLIVGLVYDDRALVVSGIAGKRADRITRGDRGC
jgi:hypothetical protein